MSEILLQCVVVLYKCKLDESKTLGSLADLCRQKGRLARRIALLIYDNSQDPQPAAMNAWNYGSVEYHQTFSNEGLAGAYNHALTKAQSAGIEWLLLFDQDSEISTVFFESLLAKIESQLPLAVCAVVPKLIQRTKILSPQIVGRFRNSECPLEFSGICPKVVTAFNSAACIRTQPLFAIGGFSSDYWLDYLDHITFHRLQAAGGLVFILNETIEHRLSLQNLETEMDLGRYANLLSAEWRFVRETGSGGGALMHRIRLLRRSLHQAINLHDKSYALETLRAAFDEH